jgi:hypothetical protein
MPQSVPAFEIEARATNMLPEWSGWGPSAVDFRGTRWADRCYGAGSTSALPSTDSSTDYGVGRAVR